MVLTEELEEHHSFLFLCLLVKLVVTEGVGAEVEEVETTQTDNCAGSGKRATIILHRLVSWHPGFTLNSESPWPDPSNSMRCFFKVKN
jgi:hypothetical protein